MGAKLGHAKFQPSTTRGTFSECAFFNRKLAISRKQWEIRPKLLL